MNKLDQEIAKYFIESIPLFNALGDHNRQLILMHLKSDAGTSVNDLTKLMPISRPAVSHHLKILFDLNLLKVERKGTTRLYLLDTKKALDPVRKLIDSIYKS